jgi:hypothetical protein
MEEYRLYMARRYACSADRSSDLGRGGFAHQGVKGFGKYSEPTERCLSGSPNIPLLMLAIAPISHGHARFLLEHVGECG